MVCNELRYINHTSICNISVNKWIWLDWENMIHCRAIVKESVNMADWRQSWMKGHFLRRHVSSIHPSIQLVSHFSLALSIIIMAVCQSLSQLAEAGDFLDLVGASQMQSTFTPKGYLQFLIHQCWFWNVGENHKLGFESPTLELWGWQSNH